jgi:hypothetical protein
MFMLGTLSLNSNGTVCIFRDNGQRVTHHDTTLTCRNCFNPTTEKRPCGDEKAGLIAPRMRSTKLILNAQRESWTVREDRLSAVVIIARPPLKNFARASEDCVLSIGTLVRLSTRSLSRERLGTRAKRFQVRGGVSDCLSIIERAPVLRIRRIELVPMGGASIAAVLSPVFSLLM